MSAFSSFIPQGLARLRHLLAGSRMPAFLRWWQAELEALLPSRVRDWRARRQWRLDMWQEHDGLALDLRSGDGEAVSGIVALGPQGEAIAELETKLAALRAPVRRWLLLKPDRVLRPRLDLPQEAAPRLAQMLVHELDRLTPFSTDQVVFDYRVGEGAGGRLPVELVVLARGELEMALARLEGLGLDGVDVWGPAGRPLGVNLLPRERRMVRSNLWMRVDLGLAAAFVLVVAVLLWSVLDRHRLAAETLRQDISTQRAGADDAVRLREELTGSLEAANFLDRRIAEQPALAEFLADLTQRLPDDTWLEHLGLDGDRLTLEGQSKDAAALVAGLQSSPQLRDVSLGNVVRVETNSDLDRFTLTATLAAAPAPTPASEGGSDAGAASP